MGLAEPSNARAVSAPKSGGVCAVLRAQTKPGRGNELAAVLSDLAHHVRADEPGCESYTVTRAMGSQAHFAVHARFSDWRAFEAHAETPHIVRLRARLNALLAAPIAMEIFLEV